MTQDDEVKKYTAYFRAFGASDPDSCADSQVREGIPQYDKYAFLHGAWQGVVEEDDVEWIDGSIACSKQRPEEPGAGLGPALERLLASGANREDINEVVRVMQYELLFHIAYMLADPEIVDYPSEELPHASWTLFATDEEGQPLYPIDGLHEYVLSTDPSGHEMKPRHTWEEKDS